MRLVPCECLELHQERRHQVERDANVGKLAQQGDHAPIVLEAVQAYPWQDVLAGDEILVERLVHVPQQSDARHNAM
jgi:hypothetical protein